MQQMQGDEAPDIGKYGLMFGAVFAKELAEQQGYAFEGEAYAPEFAPRGYYRIRCGLDELITLDLPDAVITPGKRYRVAVTEVEE